MVVDYRDKEAVEKLFADYRNAKDSGDGDLADRLYREIHEINRMRARHGYGEGSRKIDELRNKEFLRRKRAEQRRKRRARRRLLMKDNNQLANQSVGIKQKKKVKEFSMTAFASWLIQANKKQDMTVDMVWEDYKNQSKKTIKSAFELALVLGMVDKTGERSYRRHGKIHDKELNILKNTEISNICRKTELLKNYVSDKDDKNQSSRGLHYYDDQDAIRLNMGSSAYESGHGRKKKEEWNDTAALKAGRDRYGLNNKDILEYDLD